MPLYTGSWRLRHPDLIGSYTLRFRDVGEPVHAIRVLEDSVRSPVEIGFSGLRNEVMAWLCSQYLDLCARGWILVDAAGPACGIALDQAPSAAPSGLWELSSSASVGSIHLVITVDRANEGQVIVAEMHLGCSEVPKQRQAYFANQDEAISWLQDGYLALKRNGWKLIHRTGLAASIDLELNRIDPSTSWALQYRSDQSSSATN